MEQRTGSSSQPLEGAGVDPAFVPGLSSPASAEPEDARPSRPADESAVEAPNAPAGKDGVVPPRRPADSAGSGPGEEPGEDPADAPAEADAEGADDGTDAADEDVPDGPVFEAADRRASIVADGRGVRLALDDQECEFRWAEIGAVETATSRFGKRFTVTVHTPDRRWYPIEIEAAARSRFAEWETRLDAVLDAYFDDGTGGTGGTGGAKDEDGTDRSAEEAGPEGAGSS
ncbi:hypothetical protein [Streptomyces tropicalis]|uniref:Uncharacterized protein n=1 Tax=Streptomyces tropicalis TaxID=3034234 RepID=A0ABT6A0I0_9ACTN|nr:hypothetical protein [Streptomyces tropicalis]MDF3298151.1 hypothetical protein [Streptomyces tropicalis]